MRSQPRSIVVAAVAFSTPLLFAYGVSRRNNFGSEVNVEVYSVFAQVIPVLILALGVELATAFPTSQLAGELRRFASRDEQDDRMVSLITTYVLREVDRTAQIMGWLARAFFGCAAVGEAAALYAVGSWESTGFLLALCCSETAMLFLMLAALYGLRFQGGATDKTQ